MDEQKNNNDINLLAKEYADQAVREARKSRGENGRNALTKLMILFSLAVLAFAVFIFATIAWFTMSREVGTGGMSMDSQGMPYTILTRDSSGYYSDVYNSLNNEAMEWMISSDYNFDNHEAAKKENEVEPGLEPGDSGILEFRVNPNASDSITVDCVFDIKCYLETTTTVNGNTVTEVTEINDTALVGYVKAHIMLFSNIDPVSGKYTGIIENDASLRRVLEDQTYAKNQDLYTKIYWVWPEYLDNLINSDASDLIYVSSDREDVIEYIASNKDGFFKDCNDTSAKVEEDLTSLSTTYSNSLYNHYNMKYDNADLEIGNNVSYVLLSMQVVQ